MTNVEEILDRTPPPILYHYTTQQGLLGIISSREIWASHTQYLNDTREFHHAIRLAGEELSGMKDGSPDGRSRNFVEQMEEVLDSIFVGTNVCVCSFSTNGDVLSQWRAYGGAASGFAIGFSGAYLKEICKEYSWLVPVLYDEDEQRRFIGTLLRDVLEENMKFQEAWKGEPIKLDRLLLGELQQIDGEEEDYEFGNLINYLRRYAPILKHKSFAEEGEWRIVTRPLMHSSKLLGYRAGMSMLIPYSRIPLGSRLTLGIEEIVVGPTPYPEQSCRSLEGLLRKNDIEASVRASEVPYRNW